LSTIEVYLSIVEVPEMSEALYRTLDRLILKDREIQNQDRLSSAARIPIESA